MGLAKKIGCLLPLALLAGCPIYVASYKKINTTEQIRYKITVSIDTPSGTKSGSGVWGYRLVPTLDPAYGFLAGGFYFSPYTEGEAIRVELGDGKTLYALLGGTDKHKSNQKNYDWFRADEPLVKYNSGLVNILPAVSYFESGYKKPLLYPFDVSNRDRAKYEIRELKKLTGIVVVMDCSNFREPRCPFFVRMDNPTDPNSIVVIDPNDMQNSLGPGYRLNGVSLQITNESITHGLRSSVPWLDNKFGSQLSKGCSYADDFQCSGFIRDGY